METPKEFTVDGRTITVGTKAREFMTQSGTTGFRDVRVVTIDGVDISDSVVGVSDDDLEKYIKDNPYVGSAP